MARYKYDINKCSAVCHSVSLPCFSTVSHKVRKQIVLKHGILLRHLRELPSAMVACLPTAVCSLDRWQLEDITMKFSKFVPVATFCGLCRVTSWRSTTVGQISYSQRWELRMWVKMWEIRSMVRLWFGERDVSVRALPGLQDSEKVALLDIS